VIRHLYWAVIMAAAYVLALPAMLLMFAAEKLNDYADERQP
jgi:ABC-type glycerol-3-phosphate transport system permease component